MNSLKGINLYQLVPMLSQQSDEEFQHWLQRIGLLHSNPQCVCGRDMRYLRKSNGGQAFRCRNNRCRKEVGFLHGTIFDGAHLSLKEVFLSDKYLF
jgi:hypothetical protein